MARAQAVQAEACGLLPSVDMNPILLKPSGPQGSQLILKGRAQPHQTAREYYSHFDEHWGLVTEMLESWRAKCDVLVLEGAGSPVELNLADHDLVNLRPLRYLHGKAFLVGDIDRGGIFAQLAGTWQLMAEQDRAMLLGAIVNRFRGDLSLFPDPNRWLNRYAPGFPVLGTVPLRPDLQPEEEDGLAAGDEDRGAGEIVAWVRLPHVANLTDCQPWWRDQGVRTRWVASASELASARAIVIPGTKNTMADMRWLKKSGFACAILRAVEEGIPVVGICGGYQILGEHLSDPHGVAGDAGEESGLGLLPIRTRFEREKIVRQVRAVVGGREWDAYEIHMGRTEPTAPHEAPVELRDQAGLRPEGARKGRVWGSYLHGWFDVPETRRMLTDVAGIAGHQTPRCSAADLRQETYSAMADHLARHVDLGPLMRHLET